MKQTELLLDQLRRAFDGDAWAGPSLQATVSGTSAAQAAAHPVVGAHSIWEIVLHLDTWLQIVRQRLETNQLIGPTDEQNWPPLPPTPDETSWQQAQAHLHAAHEQLLGAVARLQDTDLDRYLEAQPEYAAGTPGTYYVLLHGLVQHNLYHAGQIALLRKAFS
ncbi:DinB family protein [Hymenobacter sp. HSC-4F20]|uniref:DinB family protein n=1 Tax=Hymenobacter sp. HSC-4F20 TaxID=2864135 RepID=UPI001C739177|nr:DinB family protein [Hymenobacter sp. HSC-4F20]MBX0291168.1 DinB family protein [Hymenobacter sp. HSC-4F20]